MNLDRLNPERTRAMQGNLALIIANNRVFLPVLASLSMFLITCRQVLDTSRGITGLVPKGRA
jgi:hypothetical protein